MFGPPADGRVVDAARRLLTSTGRVHVPDVLEEAHAQALLSALEEAPWRLVMNGVENVYDLSPSDIAALDVGQPTQFLSIVHGQAGDGFQFLFDSYRVSDEAEAGRADGALGDLYRAFNAPAWLDFLRAVTGEPRVHYVDAQATRYRPGHFLTAHDDEAPAKQRLFAYVLNLTPAWRLDWGGLLMFHAADGHVAEAYTPRWNALNLFAVPQGHSVSVVAPFAKAHRLSVTGWLRARR